MKILAVVHVLMLSVYPLFVWDWCPYYPPPLELESSSTQAVANEVAEQP
jgi:hypothetical protein